MIARSGLIRTTICIVSYVFLLLGICLSSLSHCIVDHMLSRRDYFSIGLKNLPSNDGKCSEGISHLTPNWQRRQLNCWLTFNNIMLLQPLWLLFWKSVILGLLVGNSWNPGKKTNFLPNVFNQIEIKLSHVCCCRKFPPEESRNNSGSDHHDQWWLVFWQFWRFPTVLLSAFLWKAFLVTFFREFCPRSVF